MTEANNDSPAFGVKGALSSGDLVVKKPGPSKVTKNWGRAAKKTKSKARKKK